MPTLTAEPRPKRFSRSEYYRMSDAGFFQDQRVELIAGEIIVMPPINNPHAVGVGLVERTLAAAFGNAYWVRSQSPLHLAGPSEPQPDAAVVLGHPREFKAHPKSALLVIEVSDSTLLFDQMVKASLYASNGIHDYWIVNIPDDQLEVYREPVPERSRRFGFKYASIVTLKAGEFVTPLALPRKKIAVADLLP